MSNLKRIKNVVSGPNGPTVEFLRHHAVKPPVQNGKVLREAFLIRARIETLLDDDLVGESDGGRIDKAEYEAALRWRGDYEESEAGAVKITLTLLEARGGGQGDGFTDRRINAVSRLMAARRAIGPHQYYLLYLSVVLDKPWLQIGRACHALTESGHGVSDKTAKVWVCNALRDLNKHYETIDGVAGKVKRAARVRTAYAANDVANSERTG